MIRTTFVHDVEDLHLILSVIYTLQLVICLESQVSSVYFTLVWQCGFWLISNDMQMFSRKEICLVTI